MISRLGNIPVQIVSGGRSVAVLPNEYQEVEYIEQSSTGTMPVINTGLTNNQCKEIRAKTLMVTNASNIVSGWYTTNENNGSSFVFIQLVGNNNGARCRLSNGWKDYGGSISYNTPYEVRSILKSGQQKLYVNGTVVYNGYETYYTPANNIFIGGRGTNDSGTRPGRFYYFKCLDGSGNIIKNFIPCYRKADNVVGMYDLINNAFHAGAGEGAFITGPSIVYPPLTKTVYKINL